MIFYHKGSFFSRDNIHPGMMTVHPAGFTHGPHPKAFNARRRKGGKTETDEVAVMIDTRDAIDIASHAGRRRVRGLREVVAAGRGQAGGGIGDDEARHH